MMQIRVGDFLDRRYRIYADGTFVAAYSIGRFRPYIYPLCTPRGLPVTEESPPDHPHHQSLWIGQDEVNDENFWLNRPTCGRVAGPAPDISTHGNSARFEHDLFWTAAGGRRLMSERRTTVITATPDAVTVDVRSARRAVTGSITFGATKEAGLGVRVADALDEYDGGTIRNSAGATGESGTFDQQADWIDYSGTLGGVPAGVAIFPHPGNPRHPWFTRGYGLVTSNPHRFCQQTLARNEVSILRWRVAVHEGDVDVADMHAAYLREMGAPSGVDGAS